MNLLPAGRPEDQVAFYERQARSKGGNPVVTDQLQRHHDDHVSMHELLGVYNLHFLPFLREVSVHLSVVLSLHEQDASSPLRRFASSLMRLISLIGTQPH